MYIVLARETANGSMEYRVVDADNDQYVVDSDLTRTEARQVLINLALRKIEKDINFQLEQAETRGTSSGGGGSRSLDAPFPELGISKPKSR